MDKALATRFEAIRLNGEDIKSEMAALAEEVPIALEYNGLSHAVMLASPADLDDFALGFSLTESIILSRHEFYGCEVWLVSNGIRMAIDIASERFHGLKEKRRNLTGRTGCGLCGAESLSHAVRALPLVESELCFSASQVLGGFRQMEQAQRLRKATGATHGAAWLDESGHVTLVREDVGRHNALDKLIGALAAQDTDYTRGAALVSSRASYEMVQKCATVGIPFLAAASAPTALAVRHAEAAGLTLLGFVRDDGLTVYAHRQRLL